MSQLFTATKASQALFFPLLEQLLPQTIQSILFGRLLRCSKAGELKWTESHAVIFFLLGEREKKKTPNPNRWRDILTEELHCINSATCLPEQCPLTTSGNATNQQPSVEPQDTPLHGQHRPHPTHNWSGHPPGGQDRDCSPLPPAQLSLCSSVYLRSAFTSYPWTTSAAGFQRGGAILAGNSVPMCSTSKTSVLLRCSPPLSLAGLFGD